MGNRYDQTQLQQVPNSLSYAYLIALTIVAFFAITSHQLINNQIEDSRNSGYAINLAGKQRMLTLKIYIYAHKIALGDTSATLLLNEYIDQYEHAHKALVLRNGDMGLELKNSAIVNNMYFSEPNHLDRRVKEYVALARQISHSTDKATQEEALYKLDAGATNDLLPLLNKVVNQLSTESEANVDHLKTIQNYLLLIILLTLGVEAMFIFRPLVQKVKWAFSQLVNIAMLDALSGIPNRGYFETEGKRLMLLMQRNKEDLTYLMIDIDFFKKINDTFGHAVGDDVIKKLLLSSKSQYGRVIL